MPLDHDGKIRMDCSSPDAMAGLIALKDRFDVAFANDPDADRHGIVTRERRAAEPEPLPRGRDRLPVRRRRPRLVRGRRRRQDDGRRAAIIDRVVGGLGRRLDEVPVGFKWFVDGLLDGTLGFGGEESAGASFLRRDGAAWSTDKDGLIMCLLAAEMTARDRQGPGAALRRADRALRRAGLPPHRRAGDRRAEARCWASLSPEQLDRDRACRRADHGGAHGGAGKGAPLGGVKVVTENGWFAARPSGTEDVYKLYAESFKGAQHLEQILEEAQGVVDAALGG